MPYPPQLAGASFGSEIVSNETVHGCVVPPRYCARPLISHVRHRASRSDVCTLSLWSYNGKLLTVGCVASRNSIGPLTVTGLGEKRELNYVNTQGLPCFRRSLLPQQPLAARAYGSAVL